MRSSERVAAKLKPSCKVHRVPGSAVAVRKVGPVTCPTPFLNVTPAPAPFTCSLLPLEATESVCEGDSLGTELRLSDADESRNNEVVLGARF